MLKRFANFINEGFSEVLYHYTYTDNLLSILSNDRFSCSAVLGSAADSRHSHGKFFFFSLTRGKHGQLGYARNRGSRNMCRIEVDGRKMQANHRAESVDYWESKDPGNPNLQHLSPADKMHRLMADNEMEERVITDKPYIEHASKYIKSVDIVYEDWDRNITGEQLESIEKIQQLCKDKGIGFAFYTDRKAFDMRRGSVPVPATPDGMEKGDSYKSGPQPWTAIDIIRWAVVSTKDVGVAASYYDKWCDEIYKGTEHAKDKFIEQVLKQVNDIGWNLVVAGERGIADYSTGLESHIHNNRGKDDPALKAAFTILFKELRVRKQSTIREFIKNVAEEIQKDGSWKKLTN